MELEAGYAGRHLAVKDLESGFQLHPGRSKFQQSARELLGRDVCGFGQKKSIVDLRV